MSGQTPSKHPSKDDGSPSRPRVNVQAVREEVVNQIGLPQDRPIPTSGTTAQPTEQPRESVSPPYNLPSPLTVASRNRPSAGNDSDSSQSSDRPPWGTTSEVTPFPDLPSNDPPQREWLLNTPLNAQDTVIEISDDDSDQQRPEHEPPLPGGVQETVRDLMPASTSATADGNDTNRQTAESLSKRDSSHSPSTYDSLFDSSPDPGVFDISARRASSGSADMDISSGNEEQVEGTGAEKRPASRSPEGQKEPKKGKEDEV